MRRSPIYHSTYTGKPPDEPAVLGAALNELFVPLLQKQFPEIVDFYLPPEGCSYRLAVVSMKKQYPGHAKRVMFGVWSYLRQFMYTKFIVVCDDDVDVRDWKEVIWALTTRVDPARDTTLVREHADRLPGFRQPGFGPGLEDGHRRDRQVAGGDRAPLGPADRHGRRGEASRGCALAGPRALDSASYPGEQRVERRFGLRRVRVVDDHHHRVAPAAAVEHVARHRARVGEQAGLDVRIARRPARRAGACASCRRRRPPAARR